MFKKAALVTFLSTAISTLSYAQSTYLQLGQEDYHLLDRLETKTGTLSPSLFLSTKPVSRKGAVNFLLLETDDTLGNILTAIDEYNIEHALSVSGEWLPEEDGALNSKKPWFKRFYKKQPDFLYVKKDKFFFSANPILTAGGVYEKNNPSNPLFTSNRGMEVRGWIAKKIGFYTYFTDNQEETPGYVTKWIDSADAVPGADFFTRKGTNKYDYLAARGYVDFAAIKDHVNVTFGYDKHFIGDGMRSLFLSDFGAATAFLRLNTRIWKFNYQNLYMELTPQRQNSINQKLPHKYATMHHLSLNATRWLNFGIFEAVIFDRKDRYEFGYMNPIILYRQVERSLGSPDNVLLGLDGKAIVLKRLQLYGQLLLDEFTSKELISGNGYWANKFAIQAGGKYFDAAGIKNLDLQGEINIVRPFTYAHFDSTANYTHYNQPLAHPLGAGFAEFLGVVRYQPVEKLYLSMKGMYYIQGADTGNSNFGNNIFKTYITRTPVAGVDNTYGYTLISGVKTQCASLNLNASYELRENLFIDLGFTHRRFAYEAGLYPTIATTYLYGGIRLNFVRRDYNLF